MEQESNENQHQCPDYFGVDFGDTLDINLDQGVKLDFTIPEVKVL